MKIDKKIVEFCEENKNDYNVLKKVHKKFDKNDYNNIRNYFIDDLGNEHNKKVNYICALINVYRFKLVGNLIPHRSSCDYGCLNLKQLFYLGKL